MTTPLRTILVALDASPRKERVLSGSLELAEALGAELVLMRAVGLPAEIPPEALRTSPDELPKLLSDAAYADLTALAARVPPTIPTRVRVEVGVAADSICRVAEELDAYLVVVGSHGHSRLERMLGTTATRVVNHCPRTVVVVRDDA